MNLNAGLNVSCKIIEVFSDGVNRLILIDRNFVACYLLFVIKVERKASAVLQTLILRITDSEPEYTG